MKTIAISLRKGGTGKTTTTINLAAALGLLGYQVLVIDLDSQGHATEWLGVAMASLTPEHSSYGVLTTQASLAATLWTTAEQGVQLCPAHPFLAKAAKDLGSQADGFFVLQEAIEQFGQEAQGTPVDILIVDCAPASDPLTFNALIAADLILAPVFVEALSLQGLKDVYETVQRIRKRLSPDITDPYVLLNNYEGRAQVDRQIYDDLRVAYGDQILQTVIGRDAPLREAFIQQASIFRHRRTARAAAQFRDLANEIVGLLV